MTVRDSYTIEIARSIADTVEELLGARPYLVINNLNRFSDKAIHSPGLVDLGIGSWAPIVATYKQSDRILQIYVRPNKG